MFLRAIMVDIINRPEVAAPKEGNIKSFYVLFRCSYSVILGFWRLDYKING